MSDNDDEITQEFMTQEIAHGRRYYLVLLKLGPAERTDPTQLEGLQAEHRRHLLRLRRIGKLVIHGPVLDNGTLRGLSIFAAQDAEEVERYLAEDPMVSAGYLLGEIYPWEGMPGDSLP